MYKVVLVDDEELIIEGMRQLIGWESLGCRIVGTAYDGDEALDIINETEPDIIITDIRMPAMNGLEMIGHVKESFPDVVIMILSGYSDFEYAQQALEKGAACYMLKPVLEKDLKGHIMQAVKKLDEKRLQRQKEDENKVRLYRLKRGAKENFLRKLLKEELSRSYINHMWDNMELCVPKTMIQVALLDTDIPLEDTNQTVIKFAIDNVIEEICTGSGSCESVSLGYESSAVLFMCDGKEEEAVFFREMIARMLLMVEKFCQVSMSAGISRRGGFPSGIRDAFGQAEDALKRRFYEISESRIYEDKKTEKGRKEERCYRELAECKERLMDAVQKQEKRTAMLQLGRICHLMFEEAVMEREEIYAEVLRILTKYHDILFQHQIENGVYDDSKIFKQDYLYQFKTACQLRSWLETVTEQVMEFLGQESSEASTRLIDRVKYYISQNYQTVSRQNAADYFFLNPSYLSQLFKAETGEAFTDYVTDVRMEKAKGLLWTTDYKIQYIAELVGYTSNQHFTRMFKKHTGMLPVEYRKHKNT